jgi:hypothetical protein
MPEPVKIPLASLEYQARFERPHIGFIGNDRARAFEDVVTALLPFNLSLANTEMVMTGTAADQKAIFRIPERGITLQFGAEEYKFTKEGVPWKTAKEDAQVLVAAEDALMEGTTATIGLCSVTIAMHIQPLTKTREDLLAPFVPAPFKELIAQRQATSYGTHLAMRDLGVLLDFSNYFANGIFLRFVSQVSGHPPFPEIMPTVRNDQEILFRILDIEEVVNA